jgi:signal transduction histidine kinase
LDITEHKRAEVTLRQAIRKLTLLSDITRHDINKQITILTRFLRILEKKQSDSSFSDYFKTISTTVKLISAMIQFTKTYEEIGIHALTWQDTHTLWTAAKEIPLKKIIMKNGLPSGLEVFADPMLVKVFYYLIDNAVSHGEKVSTIRFIRQKSGDDYIIICEDDGVGISVNKKEHIFERDFGNNTGLGLFLPARSSQSPVSPSGKPVSRKKEHGRDESTKRGMAVCGCVFKSSLIALNVDKACVQYEASQRN